MRQGVTFSESVAGANNSALEISVSGITNSHSWLANPRVGEGLVDRSLANRADLNEVLFGVKKNDPKRFAIEKAHLGTKVCDCKRTIDGQRLAFLP